MKKYIAIYHMNEEARQEASNSTPEQQAEGMKPWFAWKDSLGDRLIDFGAPLASGQRLNPDGTSGAGNSEVAGYSIVQANDMDEAKTLFSNHPHLGWNAGCDIELHEMSEM